MEKCDKGHILKIVNISNNSIDDKKCYNCLKMGCKDREIVNKLNC